MGVVSIKKWISRCAFTDDLDPVVTPEDGEVVASDGISFCPRERRVDYVQDVTDHMRTAQRAATVQTKRTVEPVFRTYTFSTAQNKVGSRQCSPEEKHHNGII